MKRRAFPSPLPPVLPAASGAAPVDALQGVLFEVPTLARLRDAELELPPEAEEPPGEQESGQLALLLGGAAPEA
ncbi:MAG: hypothetical protein L0Y66_00330 [Myxococcaceae bacterium]|nr:hypothetical protein [Myxococcaceae bacterium]MCI0671161.1 hypothetical protein [Myxococcaceae bacterium]